MLTVRTKRAAALLLATTAIGLAPPAWAQDAAIGGSQESLPLPGPQNTTPVTPVRASLTLSAGSGQVLHLHANAINVFTADPKVAEVRPASSNSLFVFGVAPGTTTVAALNAAGDAIAQYQVSVVPSGFDAGQVRGSLSRGGGASISTRATESGVSLGGHVATPGDAERAMTAAKGSLPPDAKVDNRLLVNQSIQVGLHVRIAEMTRSLVRELGVNWTAVGQLGKDVLVGAATQTQTVVVPGAAPSTLFSNFGRSGVPGLNNGYNLNTTIDALSQDNLVHTLAEPNLTTLSGQPASFLVGGEFPIPVATSQNTISIEFKQYGISLAFVPTVVAPGRISLHVRPEVSALDKADGVTSVLNQNVSVNIPALTVRRADTTVELGSGQSMAIAGLLSDQTSQTVQATPGLGDVPILGALFRSDSFQRSQTELVIVITPYIVRPVSDPSALHLPSDGFHAPNDFERILELRQLGRGSYQAYGRIPADAGFIVE